MYQSEDQPLEPGLFVAAFFDEETNEAIQKFLTENNIPNAINSASLHTTIVHSRVPVPDFEPNHSVNVVASASFGSIECWDIQNNKRCLVLQYFSPYLHFRFQEAMNAGATYDYDEYKPHITLSYDVGPDFDHTTVPQPTFPIKIIGEYCEPIEPD